MARFRMIADVLRHVPVSKGIVLTGAIRCYNMPSAPSIPFLETIVRK